MIRRLVDGARARAGEMLSGLAPRERLLLLVALGTCALLVLWLGVYEPMVGTLTRLDRQIGGARRDLAAVAALADRYRSLRREVADLESGGLGADGPSLFARLEATAVPIVGRERIVSMNPSSRPVSERFEEDRVDLRLEGVPLRDVIELLHTLQHADPPMRVARASMKREYKDPSLIDATIVVSRLAPK